MLPQQRPDHYRGSFFTVVGIIALAFFGGIGGGVTRDVLLNVDPAALTDAGYIVLCFLAGILGLLIAFGEGQKFRETLYQFFTAFSLPWFEVVGVQKGLEAERSLLGVVFLGVAGPTAGRFLIDVTCGVSAKQFVQGEWFVGAAVLTSFAYYFLRARAYDGVGLSLSFTAATLLAFVIGFVFRLAAIWFGWEEPMPRVPDKLLGGLPKRWTLKEKMQPGWEPEE